MKYLLFIIIGIVMVLGLAQNVFALTISPPLYEIGAAPGQVLSTGLKVINETSKAGTFYFESQNFAAKGEEGEPYFIAEDGLEGLASWIELPEPIHLEPGEKKEVVFTMRIPDNAQPGGHYAAIFLSTSPPAEGGSGSVGVASKLGTLVLLRIGGDVIEQGRLAEFSLKQDKRMYEHLPVTFEVRIENTGTVHIKPAGTIEIRNIFGTKTDDIKVNIGRMSDGREVPIGNVLPQSVRKFESDWTKKDMEEAEEESPKGFWEKVKQEKDNFALGRYTAYLDLSYGLEGDKDITAQISFWIFPWHLLSIIFAAVILFAILLFLAIRRYNRWIVKKALSAKL